MMLMKHLITVAITMVVLVSSAMATEKSTLRAISMDGDFSDWEGIAPLATGTTPAAAGQIRFRRVWATNDQDAVYFRIEVGRETIWQEPTSSEGGNAISLYVDGNAFTTSGASIEGLDVNFQLQLGGRALTVYTAGGDSSSTYNLSRAGVLGFPDHSSDTFEFRIPRTIRPFSTNINLVTGSRIRFFLRQENGDRLPAQGFIEYNLASGTVSPPEAIPLNRIAPDDVRILVHNGEDGGPADADRRDEFIRILQTTQPDIICFQEIYSPFNNIRPDVTNRWSAAQTRDFVASVLSPAPGTQWHAAQSGDNVTVSKWPILATAGTTRFLVTHIAMPGEISPTNLVIFNAHTPCCQNNSGRDAVHDEISSTWRNLLNGTGPFTISPDAAVMMVGDFNMVGFVRQLETLRDGRIINTFQYGPRFSPGRANESLVSAPLRHTHARTNYTWRRLGPSFSDFSPGKLDYILFSDDVATLRRNYTLDSSALPSAILSQIPLTSTTTTNASDHLPLIADFRFLPEDTADGWVVY